MAKKKIQSFNITTPDIRTVYLGKGVKQKAEYIQLPGNYGRQIFDEDLAAGASIYSGFKDTLSYNSTRYNFITAPTLEEGLRAVTYLAGIHAEEECYDRNDVCLNDYEEACYSQEAEFDVDDPGTWGDLFDEDDEDNEDDGPVDFYTEEFYRIPIIPIESVSSLDGGNQHTGFGMFSMELQNNSKKQEPWWNDCIDYSVCIVVNENALFRMFEEEALPADKLESLKRFSANDHVYILVIGEDIQENDFSVNKALLEYTANCFRVGNETKELIGYYKRLLEAVAVEKGFTFSKTMDVSLLAEKLATIDKQHVCSMYEKIMKYFTHMGVSSALKAKDFDSLGLKKLIDMVEKGNAHEDLDCKLVGMEEVKHQVKNIVNMMRYVKLRANKNIKGSKFHNVHLFIGAPGTAKTTVAKMMSTMMLEEGLIKGGRFISVTGAQLKGEYVGQTAPKVHALFDRYDAIFIDEAYSLTSNAGDKMDSYAQEALAQLAVELEEHGTDKLVIFAGYGGRNTSKKDNLMYDFLQANPGISSRINSTIYFDSYSPSEMVSILHGLAEQMSLKLPEEQDSKIAEYFETRRWEDDFGNGREARVFLEQCERNVAERIAGINPEELTDDQLNTIIPEDIHLAIEELKSRRLQQQGKYTKTIGFA